MTLTYVDSGVLLALVRGGPQIATRALDIGEATDRTFASSAFVRLELLPKARYFRRDVEVAMYESFFARVSRWAEPLDRIVELAERHAVRYGLSAVDALHIAAADVLGVEEFVTAEGPTKPLLRVQAIVVRSIHMDPGLRQIGSESWQGVDPAP